MARIVGPAVRSADFAAIFNDTRAEIIRLKWHFIHPHLGMFASPSKYEHDVKAYCVLSHAALEQCFEDVALATALYALQVFAANGDVSRTLLTLLSYHGRPLAVSEDETDLSIRTADTLRDILKDAKRTFSDAVANNHGIFFPYLASLLEPVGIDIQLNLDEREAIKRLKEARGEHAHAYVTRQIQSPEDAAKNVQQCLLVARRVASNAADTCGKPKGGLRRVVA